MVKLKIRKERLEREEELVSDRVYGDIEHYHYDRSVNRVDIDTSEGAIDIYIDGKRIKPKRYVLPMEGTRRSDGQQQYASNYKGVWGTDFYPDDEPGITSYCTVTQSDIDAAPDWVKAIKPVEVKD